MLDVGLVHERVLDAGGARGRVEDLFLDRGVDREQGADLLGVGLPVGRLGVRLGELVVLLEQGADFAMVAGEELDGIRGRRASSADGTWRSRAWQGSWETAATAAVRESSAPWLGAAVGDGQLAAATERRVAVGLPLQRTHLREARSPTVASAPRFACGYRRPPCPHALSAARRLGAVRHACSSPPPSPLAAAPPAPSEPVVDTIQGVRVADPYRNLENLKSPATLAWLKAKGDEAAAQLARIEGRDAMAKRIAELAAASGDSVSGVVRMPGERVFFLRRKSGETQFKLVMRSGAERLPSAFSSTPRRLHAATAYRARSTTFGRRGTASWSPTASRPAARRTRRWR